MLKKIISMLVVSICLFSMCVPTYAMDLNYYSHTMETADVNHDHFSPDLHIELNEAEQVSLLASSAPNCPKCHSNKWVIPHGLIVYYCAKCNYYFYK